MKRFYLDKYTYSIFLKKMPIICVDCIIIHNSACLLVKRKLNPAKNQFWFPGGRILKFESIKQASLRLAFEECNLRCNFKSIISIEETIFAKGEFGRFKVHTINICCLLQVDSINKLILDKNHSEYIFTNHPSSEFHPSINNVINMIDFK